jgi:hypothetical protein
LQCQLVIDWLEQNASEQVREVACLQHFTDKTVAWENTLHQLQVSCKSDILCICTYYHIYACVTSLHVDMPVFYVGKFNRCICVSTYLQMFVIIVLRTDDTNISIGLKRICLCEFQINVRCTVRSSFIVEQFILIAYFVIVWRRFF